MSKKNEYHFEMSERKFLLRFLDVGMSLIGLHLIGTLFSCDYFVIRIENYEWSLLLGVYILFFGTIFENYDLRKSSNFFVIFKGIVVSTSVVFVFYILTPFLSPILPERRIQMLYFFVTIIAFTSLGRLLYIWLILSPKFVKSVLVIANGEAIPEIIKNLKDIDPNYKIGYYINTNGTEIISVDAEEITEDSLLDRVRGGVQEIVVTDNSNFSSSILYNKLLLLFNEGYVIKEYAQVYEELANRVYVSFTGDNNLYQHFPFSKYNNKQLYRVFHRFFDFVSAIVGLLIFSILLPIIFIINLFANKGPLFYSQMRVGRNGIPFQIFKLRSMIVNAEKNGAVWAQKNDVRITKFGKFLRKTRLDEFPQFYNILKGEMSVIGPRPERPVFVNQLSEEISFYATRHMIKPGLTGWAQVKTQYGATVDDSLLKLQYDLYYIKHRSVFLDFNIIMKTLSTVLHFRGQ